jgi:hypothetical protein
MIALRLRPRVPRQPPARSRGARRASSSSRRPARGPTVASCSAAAGWGDKDCPPTCARAATSHARPQRLQRDAEGRAERQSRQHGDDGLLAGDARLRGGGGRRVPDHGRVGGHRASSSSRLARCSSPATAEEVAGHLDRLTPGLARVDRRGARARVLAEHTYAHRAAQVSALLDAATRPPSSDAMTEALGRRPRALDHLVLGQRPRDDVPRPRARAGGQGARRALPRAGPALVLGQPRHADPPARADRACTSRSRNCAIASPPTWPTPTRDDRRLLRAGWHRVGDWVESVAQG